MSKNKENSEITPTEPNKDNVKKRSLKKVGAIGVGVVAVIGGAYVGGKAVTGMLEDGIESIAPEETAESTIAAELTKNSPVEYLNGTLSSKSKDGTVLSYVQPIVKRVDNSDKKGAPGIDDFRFFMASQENGVPTVS